MKDLINSVDDLTRRDFAAYAAKACLGVSLLPMLGNSLLSAEEVDEKPTKSGTAKNVIYLYMSGGMTHMDTFDPKPGHENQGPVEAIRTSAPGVQISGYLPMMAKHMDKAAIVRGLTSTQGAHERGRYLMKTSYTQRGTIRHPAMGAWLLRLTGDTNRSLPGNVRIGGDSQHPGAGFMEAQYSPLPIGDPTAGLQNSKLAGGVSEEEFRKRLSLAQQMDSKFRSKFDQKQVRSYTDSYADAIKLMSSTELEAFNLYRESESTRQAYGEDPFGQGCLLARRLVENGVRFVEVSMGGWDTHQQNFIRVPEQAAILDQAMSTLIGELADRGMLETTMVVLATEFGRTPKINQNQGRDHYPRAFSGVLAGGGIKGGAVFGKTDPSGSEVVEDVVEPPEFNATIAAALGLPLMKVIESPSKRPFTVADKAKPIEAIL